MWEMKLLPHSQVVWYVALISSQCVQQDETGSHDEKKNAGRNPPAANEHAQLCFCSHGEKEQGHPMDLFLLISVLQAIFCWLGDLEKNNMSLEGKDSTCSRCRRKLSQVNHDSNPRSFFLASLSPLSWSLERAYLDLKEFWVSYGTGRKTHNIIPAHLFAKVLGHLNRSFSPPSTALKVCDTTIEVNNWISGESTFMV